MSNDSSSSEPTAKKGLFWNPWFAVAVVIGSYVFSLFASYVLLGLFLSIYASVNHLTSQQATDWAQNSVWLQFVAMVISYAFLLGPLFLLFRRYKINVRELGITKPKLEDPLYALAALPVYYITFMVVAAAVKALLPSFNLDQQQQIGFDSAHGFVSLTLTFISLAIIPPIVEEIVMRGYLYTVLRANMRKILAAVITSIIFATGHLEFGNGGPLVWVAALFTLVLSFILIYLRERTGRLAPAVCLHALINGISFFSLFIHR